MAHELAHKFLFVSDIDGSLILPEEDIAKNAFGEWVGPTHAFDTIFSYDVHEVARGAPGFRPGEENAQSCFTMGGIEALLLEHGVRGEDIADQTRAIPLLNGADTLFDGIRQEGHTIYLISAGFQPGAEQIGERLGVGAAQVVATAYLYQEGIFSQKESEIIRQVEHVLFNGNSREEKYATLDNFFRSQMPAHPSLCHILQTVLPMGGKRKWEAVLRICAEQGVDPEDVAYQGDGNSDWVSMRENRRCGGVNVALNTSSRALIEQATIGLVGWDMNALQQPYNELFRFGKQGMIAAAREIEESFPLGKSPVYVIEGTTDERKNEVLLFMRQGLQRA